MLQLILLLLSLPLSAAPDPVRVGIIGLDTSHSPAFTRLINSADGEGLIDTYEVVAAFPYGSRTIASSYERIPQYTEAVRGLDVEIVDSIEDLLSRVDVVLLETNDGTLHLEQALQVIAAGKPLFIDKPVAASLEEVLAVFDAADAAGVPLFSSSSLRYMSSAQAVRGGSIGTVLGATTYSPAHLEPSHPDLYWYGIHGVETLFTVMGTGCEVIVRTHTETADAVTCTWEDGRIGTFYGMRDGETGYGGTAFGTDGTAPLGPYEGYEGLVHRILEFFESGSSPVDAAETIEIYAFMSAADESTRLDGAPVRIDAVLERARAALR
jgi:predicted dehydrogenase